MGLKKEKTAYFCFLLICTDEKIYPAFSFFDVL